MQKRKIKNQRNVVTEITVFLIEIGVEDTGLTMKG